MLKEDGTVFHQYLLIWKQLELRAGDSWSLLIAPGIFPKHSLTLSQLEDQTRFCYLSALMMLLHFQLSRIGLNDVLGPFNYVIAVNKLQFGLKSRIENSRMMYRRYGHLRSIPLYLLVKQERMFFWVSLCLLVNGQGNEPECRGKAIYSGCRKARIPNNKWFNH